MLTGRNLKNGTIALKHHQLTVDRVVVVVVPGTRPTHLVGGGQGLDLL